MVINYCIPVTFPAIRAIAKESFPEESWERRIL